MKDFVKQSTKIICIGRNYAKHAAELGNEAPSEPFYFIKPTTCYVEDGGEIIYHKITKNLHHELELGVVIGKKMSKVPVENVMAHVAGYCVTIDVTCRDVQEKCKSERKPWCISKCLDTHCAVGPFIPASELAHDNVDMVLKVNDAVRQSTNTKNMIFNVPTLLEYVNRHITLLPGDLVQTGTPEGVGPMHIGDTVKISIPGTSEACFRIVDDC